MKAETSVMDELWETKRKLASRFATFHDYFKHLLDEQKECERQGMRFVGFAPRLVSAV